MGSCCVTEGADASVTVTLCHAIDHLLARAGVGTRGRCTRGHPIAQPTLTIEPGALKDAAAVINESPSALQVGQSLRSTYLIYFCI